MLPSKGKKNPPATKEMLTSKGKKDPPTSKKDATIQRQEESTGNQRDNTVRRQGGFAVNQRDAERGGSTRNQDMLPSEGKEDPPATKEMLTSEGKEDRTRTVRDSKSTHSRGGFEIEKNKQNQRWWDRLSSKEQNRSENQTTGETTLWLGPIARCRGSHDQGGKDD
jgi:hypothetical protein